MLDRIAFRATFWAILTVLSLLTGLMVIESTPLTALTLSAVRGALLPFLRGAAPLAAYSGMASLAALTSAAAGWLLMHRDVKRRAGSEHALRERESRLHAAMHGSADGVFLLRALRDDANAVVDFEVMDVNVRGAEFLRMTRAQMLGRRTGDTPQLRCHGRLFADYVGALEAGVPLVNEVRVSRRHFTTEWLWHQAVPIGDGLAVTIRDIAAAKQEAERLRQASITDELTQLYNRRGFLMLAEQQLKVARRQGRDVVLFFADMDKFKSVNDRFGHAEGDRSLRAAGRLLKAAVRESDIVARLGGDEFTVLAVDGDATTASSILRRINERIAAENARGQLAAPLSLSIGHVRIAAGEGATLDELLLRADRLLYERKAGRPRQGTRRVAREADAVIAA